MQGNLICITLSLILMRLDRTTSNPSWSNVSGIKNPACFLTKNRCEFENGHIFKYAKKKACHYWCLCQGYDVAECYQSLTEVSEKPPHYPCWECHCSRPRSMFPLLPPLPPYCFA